MILDIFAIFHPNMQDLLIPHTLGLMIKSLLISHALPNMTIGYSWLQWRVSRLYLVFIDWEVYQSSQTALSFRAVQSLSNLTGTVFLWPTQDLGNIFFTYGVWLADVHVQSPAYTFLFMNDLLEFNPTTGFLVKIEILGRYSRKKRYSISIFSIFELYILYIQSKKERWPSVYFICLAQFEFWRRNHFLILLLEVS